MKEYSEKLSIINGRLEDLEHDLHAIYKKLSPVNQQRLHVADMKIGTDKVISRSANYLREVCDLFAEAEAKIATSLK